VKTISLLVLSRPDYTRRVIDALGRCDGVSKYVLIVFSQEPCVPETIATVRDATARLDIPVQVVTERVPPARRIEGRLAASAQCAASTLRSLEHGFATGADFLIHLGDDIVPARDFLHYMEWAPGAIASMRCDSNGHTTTGPIQAGMSTFTISYAAGAARSTRSCRAFRISVRLVASMCLRRRGTTPTITCHSGPAIRRSPQAALVRPARTEQALAVHAATLWPRG
jgi:hypothetical protein